MYTVCSVQVPRYVRMELVSSVSHMLHPHNRICNCFCKDVTATRQYNVHNYAPGRGNVVLQDLIKLYSTQEFHKDSDCSVLSTIV